MINPPTKLSLLWAGARATLPLVASVVPFGMLFGALGPASGIPPAVTMAMSSVVFAGSSQFIGAQLIGAGAPALVLLLTTLVVNLRHALYGLSLAPHMRTLSRGWKWLLAYLMTDEAFAVSILRYDQDGGRTPYLHWYYLGSGLTLWSSWQVSTALGLVFGSQIPSGWGLEFAIPLTFIALVVPVVRDRPAAAAALGAAGMAVLLAGLPLKLGLVAAALVGIGAGMALDLGWLRGKKSI
jgi:4-azaleucine resistance transporter AzlC